MEYLKIGLLAGLLFSSAAVFANNEDIIGKWRSIDDKTGFSKGIVEITKDDKGIYTGRIVQVIERPGYTAKTSCTKCPEPYTNKPILGLQVLNGMTQSKDNPRMFTGGTILDPIGGGVYRSTIRLNSTGSRIYLKGFIGTEALGRSQTWIRQK